MKFNNDFFSTFKSKFIYKKKKIKRADLAEAAQRVYASKTQMLGVWISNPRSCDWALLSFFFFFIKNM